MKHVLLEDPASLDLPDGPLAIDTEFHTEKTYVPRLHLIQVRGADGPAYLIDPHRRGMLEGVAPSLCSRPWIVHAGRTDLDLLQRALGSVPEVVHDTQIAAGLIASDHPASLARLLDAHLDIRLDKSETLSDWSRRPLTSEQLEYAAEDVAHLHALWARLSQHAEALGRLGIVAAACREARDTAISPAPVADAWRDLPGRRALHPERAAVLKELAAWREQTARDLDRPPMAILGNRVLFDLAKRRPDSRDALLSGRRAPRSALARHADDLLDRIGRATSRPATEHPRTFPRGSLSAARLAWLEAYAAVASHQGSWSARLVLPDAALEAIAWGTGVRDALSSWQVDLAGSTLERVMDSESGLRIPTIEA